MNRYFFRTFSFLILIFVLVACQSERAVIQPATSPATMATTTAPTMPVETAGPQSPTASQVDTPPAVPVTPGPVATVAEQVPDLTPSATSTPPERPATAIQLEPFASGFTRPTSLTHAGDERLFVTEQAGRIWIISGDQVLPDAFLDIRDRVGSTGNEQGLLSVAFHPNYPADDRFFVNYTDRQGATVVSAFRVQAGDPNLADPGSEQLLMRIDQPYVNHNGGQLQFGPDGYLYIGMGDGGSAGDPLNQGQDRSTLLGALLRVDVDDGEPYAIPEDNPYFGLSDARAEVWAYGLRNPWRFSFDREKGDLYIADVGQNQWEEVNFQPAASLGGENYGWNIMEGSHCFVTADCDPAGLVMPIAEYAHQAGNCSISGGYVYRGERYPELRGNYFFADYCTGTIWSLLPMPDGGWLQNEVLGSGINISSFGQDSAGELYVLDHANGTIYALGPG